MYAVLGELYAEKRVVNLRLTMWIVSEEAMANCFPHPGCWHLNGSSPQYSILDGRDITHSLWHDAAYELRGALPR